MQFGDLNVDILLCISNLSCHIVDKLCVPLKKKCRAFFMFCYQLDFILLVVLTTM